MARCSFPELDKSIGRAIAKINRMKKRCLPAVDAILDQSADEGVEFMQKICPVRTGDLKSTARKEKVRAGAYRLKLGNDTGKVTGNFVNYEKYVEYGTRFMAAQPTFHPAYAYAIARAKKRLKTLGAVLRAA